MRCERWLRLSLGVWLCLPCGCSGGGQTGQESLPPQCEETSTAVSLGDQTSLGFSGDDFASGVATPPTSRARFFKSDQVVDLTVQPGAASGAMLVHSSGDPTACRDHLDIEMSVSVATADGALAEEFLAKVRVDSLEAWSFTKDLPLPEIKGSFDASQYDLETWKEPALQIQMRVERTRLVGSLSLFSAESNSSPATQPTTALVAEWPAVE